MTQPPCATTTFLEFLADQFLVTQGEAQGILQVCEALENLRDNRLFWHGLKAWMRTSATAILEASAARSGGEPDALTLGRSREVRRIPEALQETMAAIRRQHDIWSGEESDQATASIGDY